MTEYDALAALKDREVKLLDGKGRLVLKDVSPRLCPTGYTPEFRVVEAARTSFGQGLKIPAADRALIRYMLLNKHTSPFEMISVTLWAKLPWPIAQQFLRHRTGHFNVFSFRYTEVDDDGDVYDPTITPNGIRGNNILNKQGSGPLPDKQVAEIKTLMERGNALIAEQHKLYHEMIKAGCAKEIARFYLPFAEYTTMVMQFDLNNLLKLLYLRAAPDAQYEIRVYADAIIRLCAPLFPVCFEVFAETQAGMFLSGPELTALTTAMPLKTESKTEAAAYEKKRVRLSSATSGRLVLTTAASQAAVPKTAASKPADGHVEG